MRTNTASTVKYDNPPIIEAIFEVYFPVSNKWDAHKEKLYKSLRSLKFDFDKDETINLQRLSVNIQGGKPVSTQQSVPVPRVRCWNKDRSLMFQYGQDMLAVNVLPVYESIEIYLPLLKDVCDIVLSTLSVKSINNLGQRFINEIKATTAMTPEKIFAIYPRLPDQVRSKHPSFALQVETTRDTSKSVALNLEYRGDQAENHKYLLDIYLRSLMFSSAKTDDIIAWMVNEHSCVVDTFEAALTKEGQKFCGKRD